MRSDDQRIADMIEASERAMRFVADRTRADLEHDDMLLLGLVKSVEIIGEAAARVSEQTREAYPDVAWADIIGMRNRLVRTCFDWNRDIIWQTVQRSLPELVTQLRRS